MLFIEVLEYWSEIIFEILKKNIFSWKTVSRELNDEINMKNEIISIIDKVYKKDFCVKYFVLFHEKLFKTIDKLLMNFEKKFMKLDFFIFEDNR